MLSPLDDPQAALAIDDSDYSLWNKLGAVQTHSSQKDSAADSYRKALELKPDYQVQRPSTRPYSNSWQYCPPASSGPHRKPKLLTRESVQMDCPCSLGSVRRWALLVSLTERTGPARYREPPPAGSHGATACCPHP